jgi:multidrug transporter EmrE-like cation transporter
MVNNRYFFFIIVSILLQSCNAILKKFAATSIHEVTIITIVTNVFYILALVCLFLQAVVWQQALNHYPLSFAYPFMSLVNFVVLVTSAVLFHEGVTVTNVLGLVIISLGITILSRQAKECYVL